VENEIVNRVAQSPLVTIDLEELYDIGERVFLDLKHHLFEGLILKEKDFRTFLKNQDWSEYAGKHIAISCSTDAIIPTWAYMLLTTKLEPFARTIVFGDLQNLEEAIWQKAIRKIDLASFEEKKVVIKGCSKVQVPKSAYMEITRLLRPLASSIMYGEPCSTVPIYKAPRK
jgi:hypothetical protein